eukprot:COSAG01_NODE_73885_length_232_cov_308.977612_1_plen_32_part_01
MAATAVCTRQSCIGSLLRASDTVHDTTSWQFH